MQYFNTGNKVYGRLGKPNLAPQHICVCTSEGTAARLAARLNDGQRMRDLLTRIMEIDHDSDLEASDAILNEVREFLGQ